MYKKHKSSKKLKCVIYKELFSCTQNAIHNHVVDRTVHTDGMLLDHHCVCITSVRFVHEKELISEYGVQKTPVQRQEGSVTLCSSILLACERMMRLKKSSSGTVGPREVGGGGAHLCSSRRDP